MPPRRASTDENHFSRPRSRRRTRLLFEDEHDNEDDFYRRDQCSVVVVPRAPFTNRHRQV